MTLDSTSRSGGPQYFPIETVTKDDAPHNPIVFWVDGRNWLGLEYHGFFTHPSQQGTYDGEARELIPFGSQWYQIGWDTDIDPPKPYIGDRRRNIEEHNLRQPVLRLFPFLGAARLLVLIFRPYVYHRAAHSAYRTSIGTCRYLDT